MVVKREYSESESGSEFEDEDEDIKPVITPTKKPKSILPTTPTSTSKSTKGSDSSSPSKKSKLDNSAKRTIAEEIINVGIKGINVDQLARAVRLLFQSFLLLV